MKTMPFQLRLTALVCATAFASTAQASAITLTPGQSFVLNNGGVSVNQVFEQGQQVLNFSNYGGDPVTLAGAVDAANQFKWSFNGAGVVEEYQFSNDFGEDVRTAISITKPVSTFTLDDTNGQLQSLATADSFTLTAPFNSGKQTGGTINVNNLRLDFINHTVVGDLVGARNPTGTGTAQKTYAPITSSNTVIWTFNSPSATPSLPLACWQAADFNTCLGQQGWALNSDGRLIASLTMANLQLSSPAVSFIRSAIGQSVLATSVMQGVNTYIDVGGTYSKAEGWGNVQTQLVFQVAGVPEPGTYTLMGLGLVGVGFMARRRLAAAK